MVTTLNSSRAFPSHHCAIIAQRCINSGIDQNPTNNTNNPQQNMSYMDPTAEFAAELTQECTQEYCCPPSSSSKLKPSFIVDYLAGVAGGISVVLVGHPFDTTKTRLQTSPRGFYKGTYDCVRKTFMWEGLGGFYAGMMSPMMGQMVFRAVSFSTYYRTLDYVSDQSHTPTVTQFMISGAMTGLAVSLIEAPIDLVKIKLQTQIFLTSHLVSSREPLTHIGPVYNTVFGCVRHIARTDGALALWQGWRATAIRNVPANTCFFPVFELTKIELARRRNVKVEDLEMSDRLIAGAAAGLGFWVLTL